MSIKKRKGIQEFFELVFDMSFSGTRLLKEWEIARWHYALKTPISFDMPVRSDDIRYDGKLTFGDISGNSNDANAIRKKINTEYFVDSILERMANLNTKHKKLIELLKQGYTPKQAAKKLKITKKGVSFILREFRNQCIKQGLIRYKFVRVRCNLHCNAISCKKCYFGKQLILE